MVVPQAHHQNQSTVHCLAHSLQAALSGELIGISEKGFLSRAERIRNRVVGRYSREIGKRVGIYYVVLLEVSPYFNQISGISAIGRDKLGNHRHWLGGIKHHTWSVERLISHAERIEIATILIAYSAVPVIAITTISTVAPSLTIYAAWVGSVSVRNGVGFPDIKFRAAGSVQPRSGVGVGGGWGPVYNVGLSVDELDVVWALCIAIPSSIHSSCLICRKLRKSTVSVHFHKVKRTVQTARKIRDVDIDRKLSVLQLEHLIRVRVL